MTGLVEDARLLTSELVTNALEHGDGSSDIVVRFVIAVVARGGVSGRRLS
ncbi:hypothetical protein [Streptomyces iconiensis]|uniref:Histidine kinase-like ATPase domain-containing protein n=1 Tax=Streptomyces iconiensis TaxID=1384038 RepID=A0ABT6ZQA3_9ACTN|nr:hypothetical protein [Streptomyces iconiensis]MDJ1131242.1 hypothetical protein [Streptomyces iconiensis]